MLSALTTEEKEGRELVNFIAPEQVDLKAFQRRGGIQPKLKT